MSRKNRFKPDEPIYIVVEGDLAFGLEVFGPFKGKEMANAWAEGRNGKLMELTPPDDE